MLFKQAVLQCWNEICWFVWRDVRKGGSPLFFLFFFSPSPPSSKLVWVQFSLLVRRLQLPWVKHQMTKFKVEEHGLNLKKSQQTKKRKEKKSQMCSIILFQIFCSQHIWNIGIFITTTNPIVRIKDGPKWDVITLHLILCKREHGLSLIKSFLTFFFVKDLFYLWRVS